MTRVLPKEGQYIEISLQELRQCCDCEDKYPRFSHFKESIIEPARREINELTLFRMKYDYVKEGKSVVAIRFHINMMYHQTT